MHHQGLTTARLACPTYVDVRNVNISISAYLCVPLPILSLSVVDRHDWLSLSFSVLCEIWVELVLVQIAPHSVQTPQGGTSSRSLPSLLHCITCFATFVSYLLITWPYHERRFWVTYVVIGLTIASLLNFSFLIRYFLVLPWIHLSILISVVCILCCSALCSAQHSLPYIKVGLMTVLDSLFFSFTRTSLSQVTPDNPLQEFHADRTLLSTSAPQPPVASIVDPKYINELVHGIGTAGLKYSVFFLPILSPFSYSTSLHLSSCCSTSNLDPSQISRPSAKSIAHGGSLWILLANTSIIIMKSSGLSVDPWCNQTSMLKYWVNPKRVFTLVLVALYISWMIVMYASGMFFFPSPHQIRTRS